MPGFSAPRFLLPLIGLLAAVAFSGCENTPFGQDSRNKLIVSVRDQKILLVRDGTPVKSYKVSTSKFGVGDRPNSNCTPLGRLQVANKSVTISPWVVSSRTAAPLGKS